MANKEYYKCSPFKKKNQFSIVIDGVKYPKRIPLYENKTINFECLNSSKSIRTILLWNKFKGTPNLAYEFGIRRPFEILNCPLYCCLTFLFVRSQTACCRICFSICEVSMQSYYFYYFFFLLDLRLLRIAFSILVCVCLCKSV